MAGQESLRAAAARDKGFLGVDIVAMAHLIQQMNTASETITGWLRTNGALPPSVPRTGLRQAAAVQTWVSGQTGMLTRRRNYAVTHLGKGGGHSVPRVGTGGLGRRPGHTTSAGAGRRVGHFPDVRTATRAGSTDAAAIQKAVKARQPIPAQVWRRLLANADDPDYAQGLYARLGPAGTADLIKTALPDHEHRGAAETSLGIASHHLVMNERWLRQLLDEAARTGVRDDTVRLLSRADLDRRARVALGHIGLRHMVQPPHHRVPEPHPPHELMLAPAAAHPDAAFELYSRHPETVHRALDGHPRSAGLIRLVALATTARDADPATARAGGDRPPGFRAGAPGEPA